MTSDVLQEFAKFLDKNNRTDVKVQALRELLDLTGTEDGCAIIRNNSNIIKLLFGNLNDTCEDVKKTVLSIFVNVSAIPEGAQELMNADFNVGKDFLTCLLRTLLDSESLSADTACMALSNLTRTYAIAELVLECMNDLKIKIHELISAFTNVKYNSKGCNLNYLGPLFSNLAQCPEFRSQVLNKNSCLIQKLLPFIQYEDSSIRRSGIVATVRNCCFDMDHHDWLLSPEVDILPRLLLPLAGPEEFDDEDMDKLPLELQYLGSDKKRERDRSIRKLLLESLNQLCAKRTNREFMRSKNVYIILREYHKWEEDRSLLLACENVIDILIRTEDEIGEDNLKSLEVPNEYLAKFEEMDRDYIKEN